MVTIPEPKNGVRYYGVWSGRPDGVPERKGCCVAEVPKGMKFAQCTRPRGYGRNGNLCKQHARSES